MKYFYCVLLLVIRFFCFTKFNFNINIKEINLFLKTQISETTNLIDIYEGNFQSIKDDNTILKLNYFVENQLDGLWFFYG